MITHHIGLLRNIIKKRKEIIQVVKQYALADNILVISETNGKYTAAGHVNETANTIVLLGRALAMSWPAAQLEHAEDITLGSYLTQPAGVALRAIQAGENNGT